MKAKNKGVTKVRLPKLAVGTYKITATYRPDAKARKAGVAKKAIHSPKQEPDINASTHTFEHVLENGSWTAR